MKRCLRRALQTAVLFGLLMATVAAGFAVSPAQAEEPLPPEPPTREDPEEEGPGLLERIVRHVLVFPVGTMQEATEQLLLNMLRRNAEGVKDLFSGLVTGLTLQNPGLKTPTGNLLWLGAEDIFADTWSFTVRIAVALWPATLAIMAAAAARDSALTTGWGVVELKGAMAEWIGGVLLCAFSLEVLDVANRLSNALIGGLIALPISGATDLSLETVVNILLGGALEVFAAGISPLAAIIAVGVLLILGLATTVSLIGQYFARVALLYVVVALAPLVSVISILRPARWLRWLWVKGVLLVMLLGPITMLLLKLALAAHSAIVNPILSFLMVTGTVSMLLAITGAVVKGIFGAAAQVVGQAVATVKGVAQGAATAAVAVGAGLLSGGAALGVLPGALAGPGSGGAATAGSSGRGGLGFALAASGASAPSSASKGAAGTGDGAAEGAIPPDGRGAPPAPPDRGLQHGGRDGGTAADLADRMRRGWEKTDDMGRMEAAGAALRGAGTVLGSSSLAGRAMSGVGVGLGLGAQKPRSPRRLRREPRRQGSTSALAPHEAEGYSEALKDLRRDLGRPAEEAGLNLSAIEHEAMAPVWAAAQHQPLTSIAQQAGFGDRESPKAMVSDFVAYRLEGRLMAHGLLGERVTLPGRPPVTPLADHPTLLDYDRGQQLRRATGGGDMATYAGLHHAIRSHAITPQAGFDAARDFYEAATEAGSVGGAIEAAQRHGASAVVPSERLGPWIRRLEQKG